jgi:hypothetical protein
MKKTKQPKVNKPKACPFCGWDGSNSIYISDQLVTMEVNNGWKDGWAVICPDCGAVGPITDEDDALKKWNNRVRGAKHA